jgi:hypothetical protein
MNDGTGRRRALFARCAGEIWGPIRGESSRQGSPRLRVGLGWGRGASLTRRVGMREEGGPRLRSGLGWGAEECAGVAAHAFADA